MRTTSVAIKSLPSCSRFFTLRWLHGGLGALVLFLGAGAAGPPAWGLTRDQAKAIVINQVVNPSPYSGSLAAYSYDPAGPAERLEAGDVVMPFDGGPMVVLTESTWFFWLDYVPAAWFVHPAAFVLVSDATSAVTVHPVEWWPVINGVQVYASFQERRISPDLFFGNPNPPAAAIGAGLLDGGKESGILSQAQAPSEWAVLTAGPANHPASNADLDRMRGALRARGVSTNNIQQLRGSKQGLCDALAALGKQKPPCDKLYFHWTGHGNQNCIYFGDPPDAGQKLTYEELRDKLRMTRAGSFCTSIEACQSGDGADVLRRGLGGAGVTSTDRTNFAGFTTNGSTFTIAFADCLTNRTASANTNRFPTYGEAYTWATNASAGARGQNPRNWGFPEFVVVAAPPGFTSIANNYHRGDNSLNTVLPNVPKNTQLFKWNTAAMNFQQYFFVPSRGWMPEGTLAPGEGAFVQSPFPQTILFTGQIIPGQSRPRLPPGRYLVGSPVPEPATFEILMGFPPMPGDSVRLYDDTTPTPPEPTSIHMFGPDGWEPTLPILAIGRAAFVDLVEPPPAPSFDFAVGRLEISPVGPGRYDIQPFVGVAVAEGETNSVPIDYQILVNEMVAYDSRLHLVEAAGARCIQPGCVTPAGGCQVRIHGQLFNGTCVQTNDRCYCTGTYSLWKGGGIELANGVTIKLVLDPDNKVLEYDEGNNELVLPFVARPFITDFNPKQGGEGTLITIAGGGFNGGAPDDHCIVLRVDNRFIDVEALTASPTQLIARLGVIPPQFLGAPLQLMVGVGEGGRREICPEFKDVELAGGNWVWRGVAENSAVAQMPFMTAPAPQQLGANPGLTSVLGNFHSGPPMAGMLTVALDKDWAAGARYCISARVHAQGSGADTRIGPVTFTGDGNRFDCARRICDLLRQAFAAASPPLTIVCAVLTNGANAVIKISLSGGQPIDGGNIDIVQKEPPPVIAGLWDIHNRGLWRKEVRKREMARWYRHYEWVSDVRLWFNRRAEGVWITREALTSFTCQSHCIYRFPNGRVWLIWRTFTRADLRRFRAHHRFYWAGRANPLLAGALPENTRMAMTMDELQVVLPMTPQDPNPSTRVNEAVMIMDDNGQQHFQGEPGFEIMPDIAENPNGFQLATTAQSTRLLPPAAERIQDRPMIPMPGMAQLQPGVIIQWLMDDHGGVLVDSNGDGWADPVTGPHVLGGQKHQGLIDPATGQNGNVLPVDQGNNQLQLYCWALDPQGEVMGAQPGQDIIGPPDDLDGDGAADNAAGAPVPMDPTVREIVAGPTGIMEQRDPNAKPVELAVVEEGPPTDGELAEFNARMAAQLPGFVPLQRPFTLCLRRIWVRRIWGIDRRFVFDTWLHHWKWSLRHHLTFRRGAYRVWITKAAVENFMSKHHHFVVGQPPAWRMYNFTHLRFFRVCYRVIVAGPNQVLVKVDQIHMVVPEEPGSPTSPLVMLSTQGDENQLFREVPPAVLAGLQPDPLPVGPDGVFVEPIDPAATADIGVGGAGVLANRPVEAKGMMPAVLGGNEDQADMLLNNQLQLYCWVLSPDGTVGRETFITGGPSGLAAAPAGIRLAITPTPAIPVFEDENGVAMDNPTMFEAALMTTDNELQIQRHPRPGFVLLTWDGAGSLEGTDRLRGDGPGTIWVPISEATSPHEVQTGSPPRFYRLRR